MARFSKKQYQMVAGALASAYKQLPDSHSFMKVITELSKMFQKGNPAFQPDRFEAAALGKVSANSRPLFDKRIQENSEQPKGCSTKIISPSGLRLDLGDITSIPMRRKYGL